MHKGTSRPEPTDLNFYLYLYFMYTYNYTYTYTYNYTNASIYTYTLRNNYRFQSLHRVKYLILVSTLWLFFVKWNLNYQTVDNFWYRLLYTIPRYLPRCPCLILFSLCLIPVASPPDRQSSGESRDDTVIRQRSPAPPPPPNRNGQLSSK